MSEVEWIIDVEEADFDRAVVERSRERPVVVDFWAPWCGPCRTLGPLLEKLAAERAGEFILAKVNIDDAQNLAAMYGVESIPAVKAFRDGKPVLEFVGVLPESQLRQFLDQLVPTESDRLVHEAAAIEATDPARAESACRRALELDANHEPATVGLARLLVSRGSDLEAGGLLARVGPGGELSAEVDRLNAILFLRQLGSGLGDESTARHHLESDPDNAQRRYELGCILAAAGEYPEALERLLAAAERDKKLSATKVREAMVKIFYAIGVRSELADEYRNKISQLLY